MLPSPAVSLEGEELPGGVANWSGHLHPGEGLVLAVRAGGSLAVRAPGEWSRVPVGSPAWVVVAHPSRAAVAAAREGVAAAVAVRAECAAGQVWRTRVLRAAVVGGAVPEARESGERSAAA
eukprot:11986968-Alexandrium_andersonii.AAC.1